VRDGVEWIDDSISTTPDAVLAARPEWREDALVLRFREEILPQLDASQLALAPWLGASGEHGVPPRFEAALDWIAG
jgi:hypothetical protein